MKEPLIVDFEERPAGKGPTGEAIDRPHYIVRYDFVLEPLPVQAAA